MQKKFDLNKRQKKENNPEDNEIRQHKLVDNTDKIKKNLT